MVGPAMDRVCAIADHVRSPPAAVATPGSAPGARAPPLTQDTVNPAVLAAEYAVRGRIPTRAKELEGELARGEGRLPFTRVVACNIGNPQALGQRPLSFPRQVIA